MPVHNQSPHPPRTRDLLHPRQVQSPSAISITVLVQLLGYLPDTHADGWLTPGKPHPWVL